MQIKKAVITTAAPQQRELQVQTLIDKDGVRKSVLEILIEEVRAAGINDIAVVIHPEDEVPYSHILKDSGNGISFVHQEKALGYGHALYCAKDFLAGEPFLHLVGDHLYVNKTDVPGAKQLVSLAKLHKCSVSAVQATRESQIVHFGVVGGTGFQKSHSVYQVNLVMEKPTPTVAEQKLMVPGLRAGQYLCFFGMHVLSSAFMEILEQEMKDNTNQRINLIYVLNILAKREQVLALEINDQRYDLGEKYGLLKAQLALSVNGKDRDQILTEILELFITQDLSTKGR